MTVVLVASHAMNLLDVTAFFWAYWWVALALAVVAAVGMALLMMWGWL